MTRAVRDAERVLIIGASLAGTLAAISLAQAGVRVTLIDTAREQQIELGTSYPFGPLGQGECLVSN